MHVKLALALHKQLLSRQLETCGVLPASGAAEGGNIGQHVVAAVELCLVPPEILSTGAVSM